MEASTQSPIAKHSSSIPPATGSSKININKLERIVSIAGGTALSVIAVRTWNRPYGKLLAAAAALLLKRGATGFCEVNALIKRDTANEASKAIDVTSTFSINKPREEVYAFWRQLENLPMFMKHLQRVEELDDRRSIWSAKLPGGVASVKWEAVIQDEERDTFLSWTSLPGSKIDNAGYVRFSDGFGKDVTEVEVSFSYRLPGGHLGSAALGLFNPVVKKMIFDDLNRFKSIMEAGQAHTDHNVLVDSSAV